MKKDIYKIDNSIDKLLSGKNTLFLDNYEYNQIKNKISKSKFKTYLTYQDSEKVILYINDIPDVTLFEIESKNVLKHSSILGSILSLNINPGYLGDIIIDNNKYYFYILSELKEFIMNNLKQISNYKVKLKEHDVTYLNNYKRKYEVLFLIVSSLRIDNILTRILNTSRQEVNNIIKNKNVILNYQILTKSSYILKQNDVFSIRKYGKYKYIQIVKTTKKKKIVVEINKYI